MPLDRSALDAGTEVVVDGGTITDSDDQWGPWVPIVPVMVPSVSAAPDAPAITTVPSVSTNPDAPAITTVALVSTAVDAPATSPVPLLVTMPSAGSSMGPPAVAVPQIKYAARPGEGRLLDYASSLRLVSMSAPRFRGGPYGTTTSSSAAASSGGPPNIGGPISVPAWDQFSTASSSGLSPQEYAALNRMPMGSSEPEVREWPKFLRVRVSGDLNYTKVLTGNAAERSAGCIFIGLSACPRNRSYSRPNGGWREKFAGVRKIAPIGARMGRSKAHCGGRISYTPILCQRPRCSYAVLAGGRCANGTGSSKHYGSWHIDQRLGAGSRQTFCNGPHWDYHPINGDRGLGASDASKPHPKPKRRGRCPSKDARGSPPDGVHPYVAALQGHASVSPGDAIESIGGRNRGGVQQLCCFEQYTCSIHRLFRLSGLIWGWSDQTSLIYPSLGTCASSTTTAYFGSRGTGSWPGATIVVIIMTGPETMSAPDNASDTGPQRFTGLPLPPPREVGPLPSRDPAFPPPVEGLSLSEQIGRYLSLTSLLSEQMKWYTTRGLVVPEWCARHASQDPRTSAVIPRPANGGTSLRFWRDKYPMLDWGVWRMFKPMVGWWKIRNPELDWFLGGPRFELCNLKDKTPKRLRPNQRGTSLFLPRKKICGALWTLGCEVAHGLCQVAHGLCQVAHGLCQVAHGLCQVARGLCQVAHGLCQVAHGLCQVAHGL